jgi:hypothetical protein
MKVNKVIARNQERVERAFIRSLLQFSDLLRKFTQSRAYKAVMDQRGDIPGWVLVVLMTTGLVTAIWTIAAPRLTAILRNSLDSMNGIR